MRWLILGTVLLLAGCGHGENRWYYKQYELCNARSGKVFYDSNTKTLICFNSIGNQLFQSTFTPPNKD